MTPRYQSIHRWDDLIQSEVHEIAASPLGDFFAAAASQGAVFVFDTGRASAIHIIQLRVNEQPICCIWNSRTSADNETPELELIVGTTHGLVATVCLNAKKELGWVQWIDEVFPDAVVRLAVCTEPTGMTLLAVAFGKQVEIWCRVHGENTWNKCKGRGTDNPRDVVENVYFVSPTRLVISYTIGGLCLWDTRTDTLQPVEDYNPPSLTIEGRQIPTPSPLETVQTDIWLDRALVVRATRQYLLAYRIFAGAQDSVVSLIHSAPRISHCDVRIDDINGTAVILQPDSPTRLRTCKINGLSLGLDAAPEDLLDHGGKVVGNAAIFSHREAGCSFVVTASKDVAAHSPWIRLELWKRADSDIASHDQPRSDSNPKVFILPVRLAEAIDDRAKESSNAWLWPWLPSAIHVRIALALSFAWIVWLMGATPAKPTDLIQRTPKQIVADGLWVLFAGTCQLVLYAVDDGLYATQVQLEGMADSIRHLYRLVVVWAHGG